MVINVNNQKYQHGTWRQGACDLWSRAILRIDLCGKSFRISPKSFLSGESGTDRDTLCRKALEYAGLTGKETVVDAYCGTGTIGMIAS